MACPVPLGRQATEKLQSLPKLFLVRNGSGFCCRADRCLARCRCCFLWCDPAVVDAGREPVRGLWIDWSLFNHAAKHQLQMLGRAIEAIVEVDVAARGVDVVAPQQTGDAPSGPNAFGRAGRARQLLRRLFIFADGLVGGLLLGLLGRLLIALGLSLLLLLALRLFGRLLLPAGLRPKRRTEDSRKTPPAIRAAAGDIVQRSMERGPTEEWVILRVRPRNFGGPTASPLFITSQAHKPEELVQWRRRSCYSSHPPRLKSHHAPLPWPFRARRRHHRARLVWLGQAGPHAALAAWPRREANVHLLCPVPWRPGPVYLGISAFPTGKSPRIFGASPP